MPSVRERERLIFRARAAGLTWPRIAREVGLSERGCRLAAKRYRERERQDLLDRATAVDVVHEALEGYETALEACSELIQGAGHPLVKIGAIKRSLDLRRAQLQLMRDIGAMPRDLGEFAVERDLMETAQRIVDVLDAHSVSEDVQLAVLGAVER